MAVELVCNGEIFVSSDGSPQCSAGWSTQLSVAPFNVSQIDPQVATAMFGSGFFLFIIPWATAWGLSKLLALIR
ncbi:hypothetical protein AYJ58_13165 [Shewanella sp. Pdp11]|uniref:hypothetical protein n=1 Tax=Shewanella sp. Pdp11 TaxID=2059264 RepID=UPI000CA31D8B|nr:hypothetical protein [Shewanella sp. Pdp11]AUD60367.1 hypothetical protein AYJ58_13120 [Shewanella sp. Pdp11]AUD60375.1 hypothetical protein AYJ58_13165 [Shewanella sp. Pdp11]